MSPIPVYLITGFLESGKTSFIEQVILEGNFVEDEKTLLILTEEGEVEIEDDLLEQYNVDVIYIEDKSEFTEEFLKKCRREHRPEQVIIEYNGMWPVSEFLKMRLPYRWELFQIVSTVDASTFQLYMNNMRSLMSEFLSVTGMAIFNRCNEDTDIAYLVRNVKVLNNKAELIFEDVDGEILDPGDSILPYDINQSVIEITDDNYGIWYLDALDHGERYEGKDVVIKGMVFRSENFEDDFFVPGRMAMTCCADDITSTA